jgi:hypothetical protein
MARLNTAPAEIGSGRSIFAGNSGRWATGRIKRALQHGKKVNSQVLRTCDTLSRDQWIEFDNTVREAAGIRLAAVAAVKGRGLTRPLANALGKTVFQWETVNDIDDANVSLDGVTRAENFRVEFETEGIPLPIIHKDWYLNLRALSASRESGEPLDTRYARLAGRKIGEMSEYILINGSRQFGSYTVWGFRNHPSRNTASLAGGLGWGNASKTWAQYETDVTTMLAAMHADRNYGPFVIFLPTDAMIKLRGDYNATGGSDKTVEMRLKDYGVDDIVYTDQMPTNNVVMVQMTPDVVEILEGEPLQNVQWDEAGGFQINMKAWTIEVPLISADPDGRSGIVHLS